MVSSTLILMPVTVPIKPSTAVEAAMDADMSELRSVWTARISEPGCFDMEVNHSSRKLV
jgi:hypothetical protein